MIYRYRSESGDIHERVQSMREPVPETVTIEGVKYERIWECAYAGVSKLGPDAKHSVAWTPGGPPEAAPLGVDGRSKWKESVFNGHKVRDYGDGTYSTLKTGVPWIHNEKSRHQRKQQFGAKEPGE